MQLPEWFDPARDVLLTPKALRGIVHPIRLRLLELLQVDGPATATGLAARIGQSSGVASYHLRVLAEHGFVVEDTERGTGRDRWWQAVHRSTSFTFRKPDEPVERESVEDAELYLRIEADRAHQRMLAAVSNLAARVDEVAELPWRMDDWPLRLSIDEARELSADVANLLQKYRRSAGDPDPRPHTLRAVFQFQLLPEDE